MIESIMRVVSLLETATTHILYSSVNDSAVHGRLGSMAAKYTICQSKIAVVPVMRKNREKQSIGWREDGNIEWL